MKKCNYLYWALSLTTLLSTTSANALHVDGYLSAGGTMPRLVNQSNVQVFDDMVNRYITQRQTVTRGTWGGGVALRAAVPQTTQWDISLGLAGYALDFGGIKGTKYPAVNVGDFDPLNYRFKARSAVGLVEGRLIYTAHSWQPYLIAGLGGANNTLDHYHEMTLGTAVPGQLFTHAHHHAAALEAGGGIKRTLFTDTSGKSVSIALDYRYFNTGSGHLGAFDEQTTHDRLRIHHLETDALLLTLNLSV
jgi:opacity protein-like surface antigen